MIVTVPLAGNTTQSREVLSPKRCSVVLILLDAPSDNFSGVFHLENLKRWDGATRLQGWSILDLRSATVFSQGGGA